MADTKPIDPTDHEQLTEVLLEAFDAGLASCREFDGIDCQYHGKMSAALAVARAVLPEGYVAVPVDIARAVLQDVDRCHAALSHHRIIVISTTAVNELRALLPDESELT